MIIKRRWDWRSQLSRYIAQKVNTPFTWGECDCVGFSAGGIQAMTGVDLFQRVRGRYSNAFGAARVLHEEGYRDLAEMARQFFAERLSPAFGAQGDLVAIPHTEMPFALGLLLGERIAVMKPEGYGTVERSEAKFVFEVP
jgi:hypothetical protein